MTNQLYGSSLFQARKTDHAHRHAHLHDRKINRHLHSHAEFHSRHEDESKPDEQQLQRRDSAVTEIVQTISVVQVIDGSGATVEVQTVSATPQTNLIDGDTGSTIRTNFKAMSLTSNSAEPSTTASSSSASTSETHSHETPVYSVDPVGVSAEPSSTSASTSPTDVSSFSSSTTISAESSGAITSVAPAFSSTTSSSFPSLSSVSNSTTSSFTSSFPYSPSSSLVSTTYTLPNSTVTTDTWVASSTLFQSSLTALGTSLSSEATYSGYTSSGSAYSSPTSGAASSYGSSASADPSSTGWSSYSDSATSTYAAGGSDGSGATGVYATPSSSSTSASSGSSNTTSTSTSTAAPTSTVVGGVVGGLAGLALLVAFAFMLVRLRKRGWGPLRLGGDGSTPAPTITNPSPGPSTGPSPGPSSGDAAAGNSAYGTMQRTAPYSVAASLAALAGGKRASRERAGSGPEMAERGFVRVSGKKLPPVLQFGGDGYTDPRDRDSVTSDASVYRDSMAVFAQPISHQRLALGSPMRPESGVMVMNPGPAKTPVTSQAPKAIESPSLPRSSTFPPTDPAGRTLEDYSSEVASSRDGVGRTLAAQDYSRDGAASRASRQSRQSGRFTEHVR